MTNIGTGHYRHWSAGLAATTSVTEGIHTSKPANMLVTEGMRGVTLSALGDVQTGDTSLTFYTVDIIGSPANPISYVVKIMGTMDADWTTTGHSVVISGTTWYIADGATTDWAADAEFTERLAAANGVVRTHTTAGDICTLYISDLGNAHGILAASATTTSQTSMSFLAKLDT